MKNKIFGITGLCIDTNNENCIMGAGKDEVSKYLISKGYTSIALADPIKRFAMDVWGLSREQLWGPSSLRNRIDKRYNLSVRDILQKIGTDVARKLDKDVWARYAIKVAKELNNNPFKRYKPEIGLYTGFPKFRKGVVISDVRFINEFEYIKYNGGTLLRVVRNIDKVPESSDHESEQEILSIPSNEFDIVLDNNGSIEDLYEKINQIILYL